MDPREILIKLNEFLVYQDHETSITFTKHQAWVLQRLILEMTTTFYGQNIDFEHWDKICQAVAFASKAKLELENE